MVRALVRGLAKAAGNAIGERKESSERERLEAELAERGLSDEDLEALSRYVRYVVKNGGQWRQRLMYALWSVLVVGLLVGAVVFGPGVLVLVVVALPFAAMHWEIRKSADRAGEVMDLLESDPDRLLADGDDALSFDISEEDLER